MDELIRFSELQRDVLTELLNIGMGQAAASLSEIFNEEVALSVPSVELVLRPNVISRLNSQPGQYVAAIKQRFEGALSGEAILLFPQDKSLELVRVMMKNDALPLHVLTELEGDALTEVGNIILNSCLGSLANMLTQELNSELPIFISGSAIEVLNACIALKHEIVMFLRMDFRLQTKDINGYVALILEIPSLEQVKNKIDNWKARNN